MELVGGMRGSRKEVARGWGREAELFLHPAVAAVPTPEGALPWHSPALLLPLPPKQRAKQQLQAGEGRGEGKGRRGGIFTWFRDFKKFVLAPKDHFPVLFRMQEAGN